MRNRHGLLQAGIVSTAVVVGLVASGSMVLRGTDAVFVSNTNNATNAWTSGAVTLGDNDGGTAMFTMPAMLPGDTLTKCITVNYTGNVVTTPKLYVSGVSGTLADYLDVTIEQASGTATATANCTGFVAGSTLFGPATLTSLNTARNAYGNGLGTWTTPAGAQDKAYRFTVTLKTSTPATGYQGVTTNATFNWETQAGS